MWQTGWHVLKLRIYMHLSFEKCADICLSSARTRTWAPLVDETPRGNMSVEHKQMKLCDKLYTDASSYEKICMRTRPCKSKSCVEGRLFTVNTHYSPSRRSNQCSQTRFRMWKDAYWEGFVSYVVWLYVISITTNMLTYVKSYAQTCLGKSEKVHTTVF